MNALEFHQGTGPALFSTVSPSVNNSKHYIDLLFALGDLVKMEYMEVAPVTRASTIVDADKTARQQRD
jgi:hypothetical protein